MMYDPYRPSTMPQPGIAECPPPPVCPVCGGLECLCRPRFFAGQLLTEADLNRLERYIVQKNKLHNRYLHGWGVVCGLEVVCHPCPDRVTLQTGYALSPCGDDIIVCRDEVVPVCELIQRCRLPEPPGECLPPRPGGADDCRDVQEDWILAICYDEKPLRGVTALRGSSGSACCSRCACGGSSTCGCGCQSHSPQQSGYTNGNGHRTQRRTPAQCEPTLICEGYSFIVYKVPLKDPIGAGSGGSGSTLPGGGPANQPQMGEMERRAAACKALFEQRWRQLPAPANKAQLHAWCCETKAVLLDFFAQHPTYDCGLYERLTRITCPTPDPAQTDAQYAQALAPIVAQIGGIAAEYERYCECAALLPPCPDPVECNCVPLATLRIRKADCRILQVCNLGVRQFVVTFPHLGYWLNLSGVSDLLRDFLEQYCCEPFREKQVRVPLQRPPVRDPAGSAAMSRPEVFRTLLSQAYRDKTRILDHQTLMLARMGATDDQGNPFASQLELANPMAFLLINRLVRPTLDALLPPEASALMETLARGVGTPQAVSEEVATLRGLVAELQRTVQEQGSVIQDLQRRMG
jgi:hypothetical protein